MELGDLSFEDRR